MKKWRMSAVMTILVICATSSQGQITITLADFASIGDTITNVHDSIVPMGTTVGGTGSQTWDYSDLQLDYTETITYVDPATTSNVGDFPVSTIATDNDQFTAYLKADSTGVVLEGIATDLLGTGTPLALVYSPGQTIIEFPSTDGSVFTDTSAYNFQFAGAVVGAPIDSVGINHRSFLTSTIDAYGSVTTPSGTYQALRQFTIEITYDSLMARDPIITLGQWQLIDPNLLGAPNPVIDTVYNYQWYTNGEDYPVLQMETDGPAGNVLSANFKLGDQVIAGILSTDAISCAGNCDGAADVTGISGTPPYTYLWDDPTTQTSAMATMLCPGTYTVMVTDAVGATSTAVATVVEPDTLTVSLFGVDPACDSCADGWVSAAVLGGTAPYMYAWDDPASQTGSSATSLMNGSYSVTVTDANGCAVVSDSLQVMGIEVMEAGGHPLCVYPNPTAGIIYIDSYIKGLKVEVLDVMGRLVLQIDSAHAGAVDLSELPDGTYHVRIWEDALLSTKKVVLIR
jgi:hypothetical protein